MMPQRASRRRILSMSACIFGVLPGDDGGSYSTYPRSSRRLRTSASSSSVYPVSSAGGGAVGCSCGRSGRGSGMLMSPLVVGLTGGELGQKPGPVPVERAPDEHRLAFRRCGAVELQPGELVPPAGEVEQTVPVAIGEPDDALGAQNVPGQALEQPLEGVLPEGPTATIDEARDPVVVQMIGGGAGALAIGRDPGGEQHLAVERAAYGAQALGASVQLAEPLLDPGERGLVHQIELVDHQEIGGLDLGARDLGFA